MDWPGRRQARLVGGHGVGEDEGQSAWRGGLGEVLKQRPEPLVLLDGGDLGAGFQQRASQAAGAGTDLDHPVARG